MNTPIKFEIAKLLKEKGFEPKQPTAEYWQVDERRFLINIWEDEYDALHHENSPDDMIFLCSAPTIAEVVMWLYEKHGIWIHAMMTFKDFTPYIQCDWNYRKLAVDKVLKFMETKFNSPTEAYSAAIEYTLKNLI